MNSIDKIMEAINKVLKECKEKDEEMSFVGSFVVFDKDSEVIDDRIIAYGYKETIDIQLDAINEELEKEKDDFVSW